MPFPLKAYFVHFTSELFSGRGDPRETHARVGDPERHAAGHRQQVPELRRPGAQDVGVQGELDIHGLRDLQRLRRDRSRQ